MSDMYKLYIFKVHNSMNLGINIHPWNHDHHQGHKHAGFQKEDAVRGRKGSAEHCLCEGDSGQARGLRSWSTSVPLCPTEQAMHKRRGSSLDDRLDTYQSLLLSFREHRAPSAARTLRSLLPFQHLQVLASGAQETAFHRAEGTGAHGGILTGTGDVSRYPFKWQILPVRGLEWTTIRTKCEHM